MVSLLLRALARKESSLFIFVHGLVLIHLMPSSTSIVLLRALVRIANAHPHFVLHLAARIAILEVLAERKVSRLSSSRVLTQKG